MAFMEGVPLEMYQFVYTMDADMPADVQAKWYRVCARPPVEELVKLWSRRFGTELRVLKRCEGGIGGDNNLTDRQIRFVSLSDIYAPSGSAPTFELDPRSPPNGEPWTLAELLPYLTAFSAALADHTTEGSGAVKCHISCDVRMLE
jgi:hypothetical protein